MCVMRTFTPTPENTAGGLGALRPYLPVLGGFVILLASVFGLAARTAPDGPAPTADAQPAQLPTPRIQDVTGACTYDPAFEPIADMTPFTQGPVKGDPDAAVQVVKVFDPNCPHCRQLSETLDAFIADNGDDVAYYYVAYPLRQQSLGQIVALKMAEEQSDELFFELMHAMFQRQDQTWGMTLPEIRETVESVGMDGQAFEETLTDPETLRPYLEEIEATANAVNGAFAREDGGISVPKLAVNGRVVESTYASYSERCLSEFVAQNE